MEEIFSAFAKIQAASNFFTFEAVQRSFLKNLLWLQALNWLIKPLWILLIEREVQLQLGDGLYGQYAVHFGIGTLFAVLLDAGINSFISREIAISGFLGSWKRIVGLRFVLGLLYIALVLLFSAFQAAIQWNLIGLVVVNQVLAALVLMVRSVLQGRHLFKWDSIVSVADRFTAIMVLVGVFGLFSADGLGKSGVEKFFAAQGVGYLMALMLGFIFTKGDVLGRKSGEMETNVSDSLNNEPVSIKFWVQGMGWFVVLGLAMSAFTRLDIQMLQWFTLDITAELSLPADFLQPENPGYLANGMYAKGYRFLDAALIFSSMLSVQLLPLFSKRISEKLDLQPLVWLGFRLVFMVSALAAFVGFFYGKSLMAVFYKITTDAEAHNMGMLFFGFMLVFVAMSTVHVFGTLVTAAGDVKWLSFLAIICLLINVIIDRLRIPMGGPFGALEGGLVTQSVFALGCIYRAHKRRLFIWNWKYAEFFVFQILVPAVIFSVIWALSGLTSVLNSSSIVWLSLGFSLLISLMILGYLNFCKEIKAWLKSRG